VPVLIERALTARKGKKRVQLTLRVHAPTSHGDHADCTAELRAGAKRVWPASDLHIAGSDSWQALVLAMRMAALSLVLFERDSGMRIDPSDWMDVVDHLADMPVPKEMRARVAEIKRAIRDAQREYSETHEHEHAPTARRRKARGSTRKR
jgi:hypothetical protein